jgi:hypothetical protein
MGVIAMGEDLHAALLHAEAAWLNDRIETVACEIRAGLVSAASNLRKQAHGEEFRNGCKLIRAAQRLEVRARRDEP